MGVRERLRELGLEIPMAPPPVANYISAIQSGSLLFTAGSLPRRDGAIVYAGCVGQELTAEEGYQAARLATLTCLGAIQGLLGDLERVIRIIKVTGYISSTPGFFDQPQVLNGASDLLVQIFGERGRHARSAVGVAQLPGNAAVEVELIIEVEPASSSG
ncbi:MAG: RidA family protein [Chloroflexi bacterium]|nr:RidA family protein [Chloroflexota bacterium]